MSDTTPHVLQKNTVLDGKYTVMLFIRRGHNAETYRVRGADRKLYFLKLFNVAQAHHTAFDSNGNLLEIEFLKNVAHPNIVAYRDSGETIIDGRKYIYLALNFIAGETLLERILREPVNMLYDVRQVLSDVLSGLQYLHSLPEQIIHNEITPQNIMLDLSGEAPKAVIIDFGYARSFAQPSKAYNRDGLNLHYVASECITAGMFSPQSDLFSVGAVMYQMLFGMLPWNNSETWKPVSLQESREKPLLFPDVAGRIIDFDDSILKIIVKALSSDTEKRFQTAGEFLQALNGKLPVDEVKTSPNQSEAAAGQSARQNVHRKTGRGFAAIAGMNELKEMLQSDVIDIIRNPEEYRRHGLGLPNGMLLYGPPGCGKTFFAERFAEEAGYNFKKVITSDIASIYVHGTQEKIGKLFDEARKSAPAILYFDELDAMTPSRDNAQHSYGSEVNEFLSQLDNIGESGVFVIASTNKPQLIDKAILRAGRLEKHFYIPPPDFEARRAMFELYLKERPIDFGIDYERLANLTGNYVSSDIKFIVDEASRKTIREKAQRITMETLETIVKLQKPTISADVLKQYEAIRLDMEGVKVKQERPRIGFK